jgi:predicted alpha/beta superfamily hydrolase
VPDGKVKNYPVKYLLDGDILFPEPVDFFMQDVNPAVVF